MHALPSDHSAPPRHRRSGRFHHRRPPPRILQPNGRIQPYSSVGRRTSHSKIRHARGAHVPMAVAHSQNGAATSVCRAPNRPCIFHRNAPNLRFDHSTADFGRFGCALCVVFCCAAAAWRHYYSVLLYLARFFPRACDAVRVNCDCGTCCAVCARFA